MHHASVARTGCMRTFLACLLFLPEAATGQTPGLPKDLNNEKLHDSAIIGHPSISPDGKSLLTIGSDKKIKVSTLPDLKILKSFDYGFERPSYSGLTSSEEAIITVQSRTPLQWKIYRLDIAKRVKDPIGSGEGEYVFGVWPERKVVVLGKDHDPKPQLRFYHVPDKKVVVVVLDARFGMPLCFSPDRTRMAAVNGKGTRIFDLKSGRTISELPISISPSRIPIFTPDNKCLVTVPTIWEGDILVWGIEEKRVVRRFPIQGTPEGLAVSPDGKDLVVFQGQLLDFFELETGFRIGRRSRENGPFSFITYFPNSRNFVSGDSYGVVRHFASPKREEP